MKVMRLDMSVLEVGDFIHFDKYAYTNSVGGTELSKNKGKGEIIKTWEDYETGFIFHVKMSNGVTAMISEFDITG